MDFLSMHDIYLVIFKKLLIKKGSSLSFQNKNDSCHARLLTGHGSRCSLDA